VEPRHAEYSRIGGNGKTAKDAFGARGVHAGAAKVIADIARYASARLSRPPADPHFI
jgi:hypothetical protein